MYRSNHLFFLGVNQLTGLLAFSSNCGFYFLSVVFCLGH